MTRVSTAAGQYQSEINRDPYSCTGTSSISMIYCSRHQRDSNPRPRARRLMNAVFPSEPGAGQSSRAPRRMQIHILHHEQTTVQTRVAGGARARAGMQRRHRLWRVDAALVVGCLACHLGNLIRSYGATCGEVCSTSSFKVRRTRRPWTPPTSPARPP